MYPGTSVRRRTPKPSMRRVTSRFLTGKMESQIRYRIQRPAISTTYTLRGQEPAGEFLIASGRRLHGLQEAQDPHDVLLLEDLLPRRHALGAPSQGDRLVEHRRHALAVADAQAPQVARRLGTVSVRRVAVRAVLVERAPAGGDGVGCRHRRHRGEVDGGGERKPIVLGPTPDLGRELAQRLVDPPPERLVTLAGADADTPLQALARDGHDAIRAGEFRDVE